MSWLRYAAAVMAAAAVTLVARPAHAQTLAGATIVPAVISGDVAPSTGSTFTSLNRPAIDAAGRLVFGASIAGGGATGDTDSGIWLGPTGALQLIAREGSSASLGPNVFFGDFSIKEPNISAQGKVVFSNNLTGSAVDVELNSQSMWTGTPGLISLLVRAGQSAPGTSDNFYGFSSPQQVNDTAGAAFQGQLAPFTPPRLGVWSGGLGTVMKVAVLGDNAPDAPNTQFDRFGNNPVVNAGGVVAFLGNGLTGPGSRDNPETPFNDDGGIWAGAPGSIQIIARYQDPAPGTGGGTFIVFNSQPVINSSGTVAFSAVTTGGTGIFWGTAGNGNLMRVASVGQVAPGTGGQQYTSIGIPVLGGGGNIAYTGAFGSPSLTGIWTGVPDPSEGVPLTLLAKGGDTAPGTGGATFTTLSNPVLNTYGQTAFRAILNSNSNDFGLFAVDPFGQLVKVVRIGDEITQNQPVQTLNYFNGSGGEDGKQMSFNDSSQFAFQASLMNGSTVIYVARVGGAARLSLTAPVYGPAAGYTSNPLSLSGPESQTIHNATANIGYVQFSGFPEAGMDVWVYLDVSGTASGIAAVERELNSAAAMYGYAPVQQVDHNGFNLLLVFADASAEGEQNFYWNFANIEGASLDRITIVPEPATSTLLLWPAGALIMRRRRFSSFARRR